MLVCMYVCRPEIVKCQFLFLFFSQQCAFFEFFNGRLGKKQKNVSFYFCFFAPFPYFSLQNIYFTLDCKTYILLQIAKHIFCFCPQMRICSKGIQQWHLNQLMIVFGMCLARWFASLYFGSCDRLLGDNPTQVLDKLMLSIG